jgi:hypothetical protein
MTFGARYSVLWTAKAESQLAEAWAAATDRSSVTSAANRLDADLAVDPFAVGESRPDNYRIEVRGVLAIIYRVSELDRIVCVVRVWRIADGS